MSRTPPRKRKALAKPAGKRPVQWQGVLLRLPPELVAEIDEIAAADRRPRSTMMEIMLTEAVQRYRQRSAA